MTRPILELLRAEFGSAASIGADGTPRAAPPSVQALATALGMAHQHAWRVRVEGGGHWMPPDAPADVAITTTGLNKVLTVAPADLVATVQAGITMSQAWDEFAAHHMWLAMDPPGSLDRTLGSVLATGTAGPLRHRYGPIRDQVLGSTVVTGQGTVVKAGGQVVKNVAGYDLNKLQIGGFGAFGVIVEISVRLRAIPAATRTWRLRGDLDTMFNIARALNEAAIEASILELHSPMLTESSDWWLLVQLSGTDAGIDAEFARVESLTNPHVPELLDGGEASALLDAFRRQMAVDPITLRAGVLSPSHPEIIDRIFKDLGPSKLSASPGPGGIRWTGTADPSVIAALRESLAEQEIPITLERAPWHLRQAIGHFGAYREGVLPLTKRIRSVFDPGAVVIAPLEGSYGT